MSEHGRDDRARRDARRCAVSFFPRAAIDRANPGRHLRRRGNLIELTAHGHSNARFGPDDLAAAAEELARQGITIAPDTILLLRTDWPQTHSPTDPAWWDGSPCLTKAAAEWRRFDFAQEEKGAAHEYEKAEEILTRAMRVHRALLPRIKFQIENLINLHELPPRVRLVALPVKWKSESAPARVIVFLDE